MSTKLQLTQHVSSPHCKSTLIALEVVRPATTNAYPRHHLSLDQASYYLPEPTAQPLTIRDDQHGTR